MATSCSPVSLIGRSSRILCRSISAPSSFLTRFIISCAVTDPNAFPVSPVSSVKTERGFADSAPQFFCLVQLACFALGSLLLQRIDLTQGARSDFMCFSVRQKIIARIAPTHFDYVRLGTQSGNVFGQDKFSQRHIDF